MTYQNYSCGEWIESLYYLLNFKCQLYWNIAQKQKICIRMATKSVFHTMNTSMQSVCKPKNRASGPGQVSSAGFWLLYSVELGSFSSSECGLGSMNYDSHHPAPTQKKSWQCYVKEIWLWLRMWQLLKIEDSGEFEWMAFTKPHWILGIMGIYRFILLFYDFSSFSNHFSAKDKLLSWFLQCNRYHL